MFCRSILLSFIICSYQSIGLAKRAGHGQKSEETDLGVGLIASLKDDANLDLSVDEEYEDLRAELLAYQAALASVISRRSMMTTPCWQAGGICVNHKLCMGAKYVTQVFACKDKRNVCCFAWNRFFVKDYKDKGIPNMAMPWVGIQQEFGGKGIVDNKKNKKKEIKKKRSRLLKKKRRHAMSDRDTDDLRWHRG